MAIEHPELFWNDTGQSGYAGDLFDLFKALEREFQNIAMKYQAVDHRFPQMVSAKELQKINYLGSFPHHATFPVVLDADHKNLEGFSEGNPLDENGTVRLAKTTDVKCLMTPAACYHFYINYQGKTLSEPMYLTTIASCFRREKEYHALERQWNFSMREVVCIGSSDEVQDFLKSCREEVVKLIEKIGLPIEWVSATDPFFNPSKNPKFLMQKLEPSKTEMMFDNRLAIGSVNFHRNYFGDAFNLQREGIEAYSGCVAFGLERWMSAICHHFGKDKLSWPNILVSGEQS